MTNLFVPDTALALIASLSAVMQEKHVKGLPHHLSLSLISACDLGLRRLALIA